MKFLNIYFKFIVLAFLFTFSGCKINQVKNNERVGKWVEFDSIEGKRYKSIGRYKDGLGKGTHRQYANNRLIRKEKYQNGICHTIYYHENGKIMAEGKTQLEETEKETHWFYSGDWKFYDENGVLLGINTYENGNLIDQIELKNNPESVQK